MSGQPRIADIPLTVSRRIPGLAVSAGLALLSVGLARALTLAGATVSPVVIATILGMLAANLLARPLAALPTPGFHFAREPVLKFAILLYALRISLAEMHTVGPGALAVSAFMAVSTIAISWYAGRRWFGLSPESALLIGAGSGICGTAAVLATEGVIQSRSAHVPMAVATVVFFGTIAMFLYPLLVPLVATVAGPGWDPVSQGVYVGSTVHAVGQVVVAGSALGAAAASAALLTKMLRVCLLAPLLIALSVLWNRRKTARTDRPTIPIPWFAVGFLMLVIVHPWIGLSQPAADVVANVDEWLLATAMASMGLAVRVHAIRSLGFRPMLLGLLLFAYLATGGLVLSLVLTHL